MADRNSEMDKLMHAIHMSDKFSFDQAALAVSVAFAKNSDEYRAVAGFYQNTRAQRSQVPLMNHINEGLVILGRIGASQNAMKAYCLHPLFQNDRELNSVGELYLMSLGESYRPSLQWSIAAWRMRTSQSATCQKVAYNSALSKRSMTC